MNVFKNILIATGLISITLFILLLIMGAEVISIILFYIIGTVAIISLIGFIVFYIGKIAGRADKE